MRNTNITNDNERWQLLLKFFNEQNVVVPKYLQEDDGVAYIPRP